MLVIPAIDLLGGRCVRLRQGDYSLSTAYSDDPASIAQAFEKQGAEIIHVVDLDGAKAGRLVNQDAVRDITSAVKVPVQLGGGIRNLKSAQEALSLGVSRVILGSVLAKAPALAKTLFAELGERAVAGIDARNGRVAVEGWIQESELDAIELAQRMQEVGMRRLILTDIARDGMLSGPNTEFLQRAADALDVPVIASGGVSSLQDLRVLASLEGVEGAIVGKALYEGVFSVSEAVEATGPRSLTG